MVGVWNLGAHKSAQKKSEKCDKLYVFEMEKNKVSNPRQWHHEKALFWNRVFSSSEATGYIYI